MSYVENKVSFFSSYLFNRITYNANAISRRVINKNLFGIGLSDVLSDEKGNVALTQMIQSGRPFAVVRLGGTEIRTLADDLYTRTGYLGTGLTSRTYTRISNLSGFFPANKDTVDEFTDLYLKLLPDVDMLCVWNCFMQKYFASHYCSHACKTGLFALEPYYFTEPWSKMLEGKRVLVIHPFESTIIKQYAHRNQLFSDRNVLPEFQLITIKAVQSLGGTSDKFETWFDALEWMYQEAMKHEFDIALIGCGAYGLPLAVKLKQAGKQAIQIGGALQLLFGIKGNRWDNKPEAKALYNEHWVRPTENEKPKKADNVEGACYW